MADEGCRGVAGVVLAAGFSTRAGSRNKLLASVDGRPMVAGVARTALAAGLSPVVVVTGHDADAVEGALAGLDVRSVRNARPADGLASSLSRGLGALPATAVGAVILLGDMPWVSRDTLRRLVAAFDPPSGRSVCVPRYAGRRGNPVLWGAGHFDEIRRLTGDSGAGRLLRRHDGTTAVVDVDDPGVLRDVDGADELDRIDPSTP